MYRILPRKHYFFILRQCNLSALLPLLILIMMTGGSLWLSGCTQQRQDGPPHRYVNVKHIPNAVPHQVKKSRFGNPHSYVANGRRYYVLSTTHGYDKRGIASWYGTKFDGRLTSDRERYNLYAMTGASPVLPIPCFVRVTNLENGKWVIVKINDRGPFAPNRIIDLSYAAATKLGYAKKGTALVQVTAINVDHFNQRHIMTATNSSLITHKHPQLYIQLGAFRELANAQGLKTQVAAITHKPVSVHRSMSQRLPIYRVEIGPLIGTGESDRLQNQLKQHGFTNTIVAIS